MISGLVGGRTERGPSCGLDGPAAAAAISSSAISSAAIRWARASSSSGLGRTGYIIGDGALLGGRDAERREVCGKTRGSDMGNEAGHESGEVLGNVEGPGSALGTGMAKGDAYLIDSSIAFARSSCSLETLPQCSFASCLERAITNARSLSSSLPGVCLMSFSGLGGELVGIRGGEEKRGGGWTKKGGAAVSNGEE